MCYDDVPHVVEADIFVYTFDYKDPDPWVFIERRKFAIHPGYSTEEDIPRMHVALTTGNVEDARHIEARNVKRI